MTTNRGGRQPRVLLYPHTPFGKDIVEHYVLMSQTLGWDVDFRTGELASTYDLIVQMGLGEDSVKVGGLEILKMLRERYPQTPILVVSRHDPKYELEEVLRWGANDFLRRDATGELEEFTRRVRALLNN